MSREYILQKDDKTIDRFLDMVIIRDIEKVIDAGAGYLAFGLMAQAIELLGALLDEYEFDDHEPGLPETRFRIAIDSLFTPRNKNYGRFNQSDSEYYLWKYLRCGMAHICRPRNRVIFTGRTSAKGMGLLHLEEAMPDGYDEPQLILVVEDLFDDLKDGCRRAKNLIKKKTHPKLKQGYITVSEYAYAFVNVGADISWPASSKLEIKSDAPFGGSTIFHTITGAR